MLPATWRKKMKVAAVIPAFNEEKTIGFVVDAVKAAGIDDIVVVSDGSTDNTALVAEDHGAYVVSLLVQSQAKADCPEQ